MAESMRGLHRTHRCGELSAANAGEMVTVMGWVQKNRNKGGLVFVDVRDRSGIIQVVFEEGKADADLIAKAAGLRSEYVVAVVGKVEKRSGAVNENLATGEIEVIPEQMRILAESETPPFPIEENLKTKEELRLKYRYLDLRNPAVKDKIVLRSKIVSEIRKSMTEHDFLEITTPILTCSSPEGARDYLVPSRNHPGKFYALPQAPQQFKQLLMTSGFDRYFQIAPCFRDEDARADRSPGEFYQLDMEMAFATQEDVFGVIEDVLPPIFAQYGKYRTASKAPFARISYNDAMEKYGTDKPDLRIDLLVSDATECMADCGFGPFEGQTVKAVVADNFTATRKVIDKLCADVEVQSGRKAYWFRVDENGDFVGGVSKFLQERKEQVTKALQLKKGDFVGRKALEKQHEALLRIQNKNFSDLADLPRRILPIALLDKGVMRSGMQVYNGDRQIGFITSGTMIPYHVFEGESGEAVILNQTGKRSIGLAILDSNTAVGDVVQIDVRGRRLQAVVTARHMRADGPFARPVLC